MKEQAFILTIPSLEIDRNFKGEIAFKRVTREVEVEHLDFTTKEDYLKASDEERELQELHAKSVVRNKVGSAEDYAYRGFKLINTVTNKPVQVFTRDEIFEEIVSRIYPDISPTRLKNTFNWLESLSECENCGLPFFKPVKQTRYCCEECKKEANKSKTLKSYYNKKRSGLNG